VRLPEAFEGKVYLDHADVVDVHLGTSHRFDFESWMDATGTKLCAARCSGSGRVVQLPQELPVTVKHEVRCATAGALAAAIAALRGFVCGAGSIPAEAIEIIHSAYSLDGLAADVFTKAHPHMISAHLTHLPALAAAMRCRVAGAKYSQQINARGVLVKYFASAVVRSINQRRALSNLFLWGMLQRAVVRGQYACMVTCSSVICAHMRKRIVGWEVSRRWRATDVVVRKYRQKQRWRAWKTFVAFMNQIRVLLQRLLPYTRLQRLKQSVALAQR
jgi:hypothetical protein